MENLDDLMAQLQQLAGGEEVNAPDLFESANILTVYCRQSGSPILHESSSSPRLRRLLEKTKLSHLNAT